MVNIAPVSTEPTTNNLGVWLSNPIKKLYSGLFSQEEYPTNPEPPLRYVEEKKVNLPEYLKDFDMDAGKKLADTVEANTNRVINEKTNQFIKGITKSPNDSTSNCCRFVKRALEDIALMPYQWVHACEMDARFREDENFREIDLDKVDDPTKLPAGCILIYDKNDGYSPLHGHIAVTLGDGRTASDLIENNPKKKPSAAFYPLKHEVASLDYEA